LIATSEGTTRKMSWLKQGFKDWQELQQDAEYVKLASDCSETLAKAKGPPGKGEGKGY
jgi:hypothetical protein